MTFKEKLDSRLTEEARALVKVSLGDTEHAYVEAAKQLCDFSDGEPRAHALSQGDHRAVNFLKGLQIIRPVAGGWSLNVSVQPAGGPLLMWDWSRK